MNHSLVVKKSIEINASLTDVWDALTNAELIKQYLFGTDTETDWQVGSDIIFQGVWKDTPYKDKGKIQKMIPQSYLQYTYWSGFSGLEDKEDNYSLVTYELSNTNGVTTLTFTQEGFANEEAKFHSEKSWEMILGKIKELVEKK